MIKCFKITVVFLFICIVNTNAQKYPVISDMVTDNANLFSDSDANILRQKLINYDNNSSHEIVILTINELGNNTIEHYAYSVFNQEGNKFGKEGLDNGLLILISKNDREVRIEVGDGLTPIITDLLSSRIINNILTPNFKSEDYFMGVESATSEIIRLIDDPIYVEEFNKTYQKKTNEFEEISILGKFFSGLFLTPLFLTFFILVYNRLNKKKKAKQISIIKLYKKDKKKVWVSFLLAISIVAVFSGFFWYLFIVLFIIGFLSAFIGIGFFILLVEAFKRSVKNFTSLFTGKLGFFIFPFYLPLTLLLFFAGLTFGFMPIFMSFLFLIEVVFNTSISDILSGVTLIHFLVVIIGSIVLFFAITSFVAYIKVSKSLKYAFGFSFFKMNRTFFNSISRGGSSRGYSSSRSSYSSSSRSSSSSYSGGGGRSSGGGSSGSW